MTELHIYFTSLQDIYHHFVLVVICSVLTGGLAAYQNDWDRVLNVMCNRYQGEALYSVQSRHSNRKEDRRWMWQCKRIVSGAMSSCYWTGYQTMQP